MKLILLVLVIAIGFFANAQMIGNLVPANTATHVAVASGSWFNPSTWNVGSVPSDAAIVHIPTGTSVVYEGSSSRES